MRTLTFAILLGTAGLAGAAPAGAATTVTPAKPVAITVDMPRHGFHPQVIRIPGGKPVRLVLRNPSGTDHDFFAPMFFDNAEINDADAGVLYNGRIDIPKHTIRSIRLIARPGHYDLKSTKALDVASGMEGQILVY